mmetsp:Transcript_18850/g.39227  ORF Transcript_18850/g.39227 Transcript_18850/m.39227 type:complete len:169 (+) Transcript_18850:166-672(+)
MQSQFLCILAILFLLPFSALSLLSIKTFERSRTSRTISMPRHASFLRMKSSGGVPVEDLDAFNRLVLNPVTNVDSIKLVFYTAPWCGPCRMSTPAVESVVKKYALTNAVECFEVITDDAPEIPEEAGITSIPTIQLYKEGKVVDMCVGSVAESVLQNVVESVLKREKG